MSTLKVDVLQDVAETGSITVLELIGLPSVVQDLEDELASSIGADKVGTSSGNTVQEELDSFADPDGGDKVGWSLKTPTVAPSTLREAISSMHRVGHAGISTTGSHLSGARFGNALAYVKQTGGTAKLLTDLSRFYPAGAFIQPVTQQQASVRITPATFVVTGNPTIFRSINTSNDFWGVAGTERLRSSVIDTVTGRKYSDYRSYITATEYSCDVLNSSGFGGLVVEVKHPGGVGAPTNLAVQLFYRDDSQGRVIYVDPVNGNDNFDGSSFEWAMKTIPAAIAKSPVVIFLKPGIYALGNYPDDYVAASNIAIKVVGGRAQFISQNNTQSAWTLSSGTVYVSTIAGSSTPVGVVDLSRTDEFGTPDILTPTASVAACQATPKSFYYDSGPRNMYVNTSTGGAPSDASVRAYNSTSTFRHSSPTAKVYLENIDFIGGTGGAISARNGSTASVLITKDCKFLGNYNSNGADIKDIGLYIGINCLAAYNANDGFNYTEFNGISPHFVEVDCVAYRHTASGTTNGSTSHNNCVGLRLGTDTFGNSGPGIADVGSATTYNVNCTSVDNTGTANASGFTAAVSAQVVIDGFTAYGNESVDIEQLAAAVVKAKDIYITSTTGVISPA